MTEQERDPVQKFEEKKLLVMQQLVVQKQDAYKYKSYTIEDVIEQVRRAFVDNKMTFTAHISSMDVVGDNKGKPLVRMHFSFSITDVETGFNDQSDWCHICELDGDVDKDIGAAVSYATKDFLLRNFLISDRHTPDPDIKHQGNTQYGGQMFRAQLHDRLLDYARKNNTTVGEVFQSCFKVQRLSDIHLTVKEAISAWEDYEATN